MTALSAQTAFSSATGRNVRSRSSRVSSRMIVFAQANDSSLQQTRRAALGALAGAATLLSSAAPSLAAYGDAANVFGKVTNKSGFVPFAGEGFAVLVPSKWNPSKEFDFPGITLRYEDNFDVVNNFVVIQQKTDKKSIEDFGPPEKFLESVSYLLGKQSFAGETISEGGFAPNRVSAASLLDVSSSTDKKGHKYYKYDILVRTADGDEGGRHQLINAAVSNGELYILKVQIGDKRWIRGQDKEALGIYNSFTVA